MSTSINEKIEQWLQERRIRAFPNNEEYHAMIKKLQSIQVEGKSHEERNLHKRFSLFIENGVPILLHHGDGAKKHEGKRVVKREDLCELLRQKHSNLGHAGVRIMWRSLRNYYGISENILDLFVKQCEECQLKKKLPKKGIVVKRIISRRQNERCQLDLIDMQSVPDGDYKFIFVYQDHLTKFVSLRALKAKTAKEVVTNLLAIFGAFGAPRILQTDNGREFANALLGEEVSQWAGCQIVHGKPRHSQSQGSVERANADVEEILSAHQREKKSIEWVRFLPLVQYRKNIRYHSGIGRTPYATMFGRDADDNIAIKDEKVAGKVEESDKFANESNENSIVEVDFPSYIDSSFTDSIEEDTEA